ncbi:hypothetical protein [Chitinophaga solisilvae]|uniref:hypothetical protein n=1 Tax=Chitinophaga solisilvae TaxID=1233460 RepID=UPI0013717787|nr:hypothetical protein [Chitinophaga solisilvae]
MSKQILFTLLLTGILFSTACRKDIKSGTAADQADPQTATAGVHPSAAHPDEVLTPGGWRPASKTGSIGSGQYLDASNDRLVKRSTTGRGILSDYGPVENKAGHLPDYPTNVNIPKDRALPLGSGWITYTYWTNPSATPISYFSTSWVVPPAPTTNSGQTIFLFNGLQNASYILQPVLQWGVSAAGGGNYWAIANWYVDGANGTALYSNLIRVNPGTSLQGIMTLTGSSGTKYSYTSAFAGYPSITLTVNNVAKLYWAAESMEAYSVATCNNYPATAKTRLSNIELKVGGAQAPLSWTVANPVTDCGQHSTVVTPGTPGGIVDIYY